jgi:energy-coupling factor transporter ATP-binding protein EcfA2
MVAVRKPQGLVDDLERLALALESLDLRTAALRGNDVEATRERLIRTVRSYLIPRLLEPELPFCVVFAGPTGSGKSTLVNSISGIDVSATGPLRPTTSVPVVLTTEAFREPFAAWGGVECMVVAGGAPVLEQMVFIDTPDIDSTETDHREKAEILIDNADVVVFVTSALRYGDLVPWEVLRRALSRGAPVINVLNRVTSESAGAVVDFKRRLSEVGLDDAVIRVPEHRIESGSQAIPTVAVRELRRRLLTFADQREEQRNEVFDRVLASTVDQSRELATTVDLDATWLATAQEEVMTAFGNRSSQIDLTHLGDPLDGVTAIEPGPLRPPFSRPRRWHRRRWLRKNRVADEELAGFVHSIRTGIGAAVNTDIRRTVLGIDVFTFLNDGFGSSTGDVDELVDVVLDQWFAEIASLVSPLPRRDQNLATRTLISVSLDGGDRLIASLLFEGQDDLARHGLRRNLRDGLDLVYLHVGTVVVDRLSGVAGQPEADDTRDRATEVVIRSHFAHA